MRKEIESLHRKESDLSHELQLKQDQAARILELLAAEGAEPQGELASIGQAPLADTAFRFLEKQDNKTAIHYRELASKLASLGARIPGKDPAANLLSHIVKDPRFVRTSPGTYGLDSWNLGARPHKPRRRRKSRRRTSKPARGHRAPNMPNPTEPQ